MSYSNPMRETYTLVAVDFSAAPSSVSIQAPAGYENARIEDAGVNNISVEFAADTTAPLIQVGDGTTADLYAAIPIPDGAVVGSGSSSRALAGANESGGLGGSGENYVVVSDLTDGQLVITYTQAVDGTAAAGTGVPYITVAWF